MSEPTCRRKKPDVEMVVALDHVTYPHSGHVAGEFAIADFAVKSIRSGSLEPVFPVRLDGYIHVMCKGKMPDLSGASAPDKEYVIRGSFVNDVSYGPQYDILSMRLNCDMTDPADIRRFFSFFMSESRVESLFAQYPHPEELLKNRDYAALMKVKGIKEATALKLCNRYEESIDNGEAYVTLSEYGLTKNAIDNLVQWYGSPETAIETVRQNPYALLRVWGYGWERADAVARKQGFALDCPQRVIAYAKYFLSAVTNEELDDDALKKQGVRSGDSRIPVSVLLDSVYSACAPTNPDGLRRIVLEHTMSRDEFESVYMAMDPERRMMRSDALKDFYYDESNGYISLASQRMLEKEIARHIKRLNDGSPCIRYKESDCRPLIAMAEKEQGFSYTSEQIGAIWTILSNPVSILTGRAGSGKSTVLNAVVKIVQFYDIEIEQCALSGRASSNLTDITGLVGKTIHRLLGYIPDTGRFAHSSLRQLPLGVYVIDEASMVGGDLFLSLLQAIPTGSVLVMVGDVAQLDPIGGAAVFKDCIASRYVPVAELRELHRQAAQSGIVQEALTVSYGHAIAKSDFCGTKEYGDNGDFVLIGENDRSFLFGDVISAYRKLIEQKIDPHDIQVLTPLRARGNLSCVALNVAIQKTFGHFDMFSGVSFHYIDNATEYDISYHPGDRVIITRNNYSAMTTTNEKCAVFNGNIGYVKAVDGDRMVISLVEQGDVVYSTKDLSGIQLAYATTVHKFQGTGIPYVIFALDMSSYKLLSKELVYTALTRAKKYCCVVAQSSALALASHISSVAQKSTWLSDELKEMEVARLKQRLSVE